MTRFAQSLNRIRAVAANTFRETVRERVLYNLAFFAVLMMAAGLLLQDLSLRQDEKIVKDVGLAAMEFFGTVIAIFIGVGLVSKEIERRSIYALLAKPLSRGEFLLGKFSGLSFTLLVNVAAMTVGLYLTLAATGRGLDPQLLKAVAAIYAGLVTTVALALLFSTVSSSMLATICTVLLALAGRFSDILRNAHELAPGMPRWLCEGLYYALPNMRNFDLKDRIVHGLPVSLGDLAFVFVYALVYSGMLLSLAHTAFRTREFT